MRDYILVCVLLCIPALLATLASFGHLYFDEGAIYKIFLISILLVILEYSCKIPIIKYANNKVGMSSFSIQLIWITATLTLAYLFDILLCEKKNKTQNNI